MAGSRKLRQRSEQFEKNITKRGQVTITKTKDSSITVGPVVLAFFLFVVVGSALLQIIRAATG
jgi:hypothetical protein